MVEFRFKTSGATIKTKRIDGGKACREQPGADLRGSQPQPRDCVLPQQWGTHARMSIRVSPRRDDVVKCSWIRNCPVSPVLNSRALSSEVLRHGNEDSWGDRTSQTVGITGDGKPSGQWKTLAGTNTITTRTIWWYPHLASFTRRKTVRDKGHISAISVRRKGRSFAT